MSTVAGAGEASAFFSNCAGTAARFGAPSGLAVNASGFIVVADRTNSRIRTISPAGAVATLAGSGGYTFADGAGRAAAFYTPYGLALSADGTALVADTTNNRIRAVAPDGAVRTIAGSSTASFADGIGSNARFSGPQGVAAAGSAVVVSDTGNNRVRVIAPNGTVTTLAGNGSATFADGVGASAGLSGPRGVAFGASGSVFVADSSHRIRAIAPDATVTTLAGSGAAAFADGVGAGASFNGPYGLALSASGDVIVADAGNNRIRTVAPSGAVGTLAGSGSAAHADGVGTNAAFSSPFGVASDASGAVFVADGGNNRVRSISPAGLVTTLAGGSSGGSYTFADGAAPCALFFNPQAVALSATGATLYVADQGNHRIRAISGGFVTTLSGGSGFADGFGSAALFNTPRGLAVVAGGALVVA